MQSFKDSKGQPWDLVILRSTLVKIRSRTNCDLLRCFELDADNNLSQLGELLGNEELLLGILAVICEQQMLDRKISATDFGDLLYAEYLLDAADALCREAANFFLTRQRSMIIAVLDTAKSLVKKLSDALPQNFSASDAADQILSELLAENSESTTPQPTPDPEPLITSVGGLPDASAFTQTDIAFQNSVDFTLPETELAGTTQPPSPSP